MSLPFVYFSFSDSCLFNIAEKVLSLRLSHQSEGNFLILKSLWKKLFNRELQENKSVKFPSKQ